MFDKLTAYAELIRLDRPVGSILLLCPTLWGLWLAGEGSPDPRVVLIFILGVFIMRSVGCAINDWFDRDIDPAVERTKTRPLARGALGGRDVLLVIILGLALALVLLTQLPAAVFLWSIPAVILTATYPLFKRFTHLPQAVLGVAFTWSIPMAFAAHGKSIPVEGWILVCANFLWVLYYDTVYAMSDREDDVLVGVKSTAILLGEFDVRALVIGQISVLTLLVLVGLMAGLSSLYYACLFIGACFFLYQYWLFHTRERWGCFAAFKNNGWFGMSVALGFIVGF